VPPCREEDELDEDWPVLQQLLEEADRKLTRLELLERWPADLDKPEKTTLWRRLSRAAATGLVCQDGSGRNRDPFRYWLPGREQDLHPGIDASPEQIQVWHNRWIERFVAGLNEPRAAKG
jgi:hypothetical protein